MTKRAVSWKQRVCRWVAVGALATGMVACGGTPADSSDSPDPLVPEEAPELTGASGGSAALLGEVKLPSGELLSSSVPYEPPECPNPYDPRCPPEEPPECPDPYNPRCEEKEIEGRMTGGGSIFKRNDVRVTHGFQIRCDEDDERQNLEVNWDSGERFHLTNMLEATCFDTELTERPPVAGFDTYEGFGIGRYNGEEGATIEFKFTDDGEPGRNDFARILIRDAAGDIVLNVSGELRFGNHQAHRD